MEFKSGDAWRTFTALSVATCILMALSLILAWIVVK
jgi:hypothetical protein